MRSSRLCFGGSFNPIHIGHLRCANAAADARGFSSVVLIPAAQPPHKPPSSDLASSRDRLAMVKLAADDANLTSKIRFEVDDLELDREGPSYTIDTVAELKHRGWPEVWWLIGADMLNYLPKWHRAAELIRECNFLILARPNVPMNWDSLPADFRERLEPNIVPAPLVDVSATAIRQRVRTGQPIDGLTPAPVAQFIEKHQLYR